MQLPNIKDARIRTKEKIEVSYDKYKVPESIHNIGHNKTYTILTYGCQMNVHDSENISGIMEDLGYTKEENYEKADVIIINTCAIRENAQNKVVGILGRIKKLKETNPNIITIIGGCMPQEESVSNMIKDKYKWVDIVLGTHNIYDIPTLLENITKERKQNIEVYSVEGSIIENLPVKRDSKIKAWVNIQYGCDKFCSYCIVPYTRGKQRSRLPKDILKEVEELKNKGYKEVTLLGQNVNAYGKDLEESYTMANLLEDVAKTGIDRIRFVTSHPWDFSSDMIDIIAKYPNIMPYIHLPIQSGSDNILKKMNRRYTIAEYKKLFHELKDKIPKVSITTDIIVGFPGETDDDFRELEEFVEKTKFDKLGTFMYSKEEGTPAARLPELIHGNTKKSRYNKIMSIQQKVSNENLKNKIGKNVEVLIEDISFDGKYLIGRTSQDVPEEDGIIYVENNNFESKVNSFVNVKVTEVKEYDLIGKIV